MTDKVLIVDDQQAVADLVRETLEKAGFSCVEAHDGTAALRLARTERPDVVVLDIVLPEMDGLEVCRRLRQNPETEALPVLMLTSRGEELDRVVGLELGADDYVTKPFSVRELVSRVRGLIRRAKAVPLHTAPRRIGTLEIDTDTHEVSVGGTPVQLRAREFALLRTLVEAAGRVLTRDQLHAAAGGYAAGADVRSRSVDVQVARLRDKLGAEGRRLVTIRGVGYRFDADP